MDLIFTLLSESPGHLCSFLFDTRHSFTYFSSIRIVLFFFSQLQPPNYGIHIPTGALLNIYYTSLIVKTWMHFSTHEKFFPAAPLNILSRASTTSVPCHWLIQCSLQLNLLNRSKLCEHTSFTSISKLFQFNSFFQYIPLNDIPTLWTTTLSQSSYIVTQAITSTAVLQWCSGTVPLVVHFHQQPLFLFFKSLVSLYVAHYTSAFPISLSVSPSWFSKI